MPDTVIHLKEEMFDRLVASVQSCSVCDDMDGRSRVLSELNGNIYSNVLFVAEAPGRLGADRTRIPLWGDRTGDTFQRLLAAAGWQREHVFISNAVLCNPRGASGNNAPPNKLHITNCSRHLQSLIDLINPRYVITLGGTALKAASIIEDTNIRMDGTIRRLLDWNGRGLIPLYHPGPQALLHRSLATQLEDFRWLSTMVKLEWQAWERLADAVLAIPRQMTLEF